MGQKVLKTGKKFREFETLYSNRTLLDKRIEAEKNPGGIYR